MTEIFVPPGQEPIYPASINQPDFLAEYPTTMFSDSMTLEEKASFYLYQVLPTEPPTVDPAENRLSGPVPALVDGQWVETWELVPLSDEEKAAYQQQVNPPNWDLFEFLAIRDNAFKSLIFLGLQNTTTAALRLPSSMSEIRYNGEIAVSSFRRNWVQLCKAVNPERSEIERFAQAAQACRLPTYFVEAILAPIPAEE